VARAFEPDETVRWLVRLRWVLLVGQAAALAIAEARGVHVAAWVFVAAIVVGAASNVWLVRAPQPSAGRLGGVLALDVGLLTALMAASGGAMNPFTIFYLVYITLSAVVLSARWTTVLTVLAVVGYGALFVLPQGPADAAPSHHHHAMMGEGQFGTHLQGMWIAFGLGAVLTGFFVRRLGQAIARQREQIASLRETAARNARLAALTTLAAGAAHELGSPLATIAVAAHEARLAAGTAEVGADLALILAEVERCQAILDKMAARVSRGLEDGVAISGAALAEKLREHLPSDRAAGVAIAPPPPAFAVRAPIEQLAQSIAALVRNALEASDAGAPVEVRMSTRGDRAEIAVVDRGPGIGPETLARIGEPFFTTKQPGRGLGLGVFLARAFFESQGGTLQLRSAPGAGTEAIATLPVALGAA